MRHLLVVLALLAGAPHAEAAPTSVAVGYAIAGEFLPLFVAVDEGYFQQRGIEVKPVPLSVMPLAPAGLISNSLQIAAANAPILLQAAAGGIDLVLVSGTARHALANETVSLVARTGSNIRSAADLKGKKVGIPGIGATYDLLLTRWLELKGVNPTDVTYIETPVPQIHDMLRSGQLDAGAVLEPSRARILDDGTGYRVSDFVIELGPHIVAAFWIAARDWAEANPIAIAAFRAGIADGMQFVTTHPEQARAIELKYFKINSRTRLELTQAVTPDDLAFYQDIMLQRGLLPQKLDLAKLILP